MFLHLGGDLAVLKKDVVAIFDTRTVKSPITRDFIEVARDDGFIKSFSSKEKDKSFIITTEEVIFSPISCATLRKRAEQVLELDL